MQRIFSQHINFPVVLRVIGWLLVFEGAYMIFPLLVSLYYGEKDVLIAFAISCAVTIGCGAIMFGIRPRNSAMRKREGLLLTAIVWVFFSAFGMLPYLLAGTFNNVTDAFFETMSGFTTTGSSLIINIEAQSHGIIFWRAATQWLGGMGIILFTLAVLPMLNYKGGIALFNAEVTGITHERMRPRVSQTAKDLWLIYIGLSVILAVLLYVPMGGFSAVCHAMTTMATGGFSTKNAGVFYWNSAYVTTVIAVFMFLGGVNFSLLYALSRGRFSYAKKSGPFKCYVLVIVVVVAIILMRMWNKGFCDDWGGRISLAFFDTIAAATSTGFATIDYETDGEFIAGLLVALVFFGGMAGSTSGGAKIDRFLVMVKNTKNEFYKVLHSNAVTTVQIEGKSMPNSVVSKVIAFLSIYMLVMVVVAIILTAMGMPMFDSFFTSLSILSNFGAGYGVTDAPGAFASLPVLAKWLLTFEMMVGRLELFTVLVIFTRSFWVKE